MHYLSCGDVCALAGVPANTLDRWAARGWVEPDNNGAGSGRYRRFTAMQAVAVAHGEALRRLGCPYPVVEAAIRFVAGQAPDGLEEAFAEGRTLVVPLPAHLGQSRLLAPDATPQQRQAHELLDLERTYRRVMRQIEDLRPRSDGARALTAPSEV